MALECSNSLHGCKDWLQNIDRLNGPAMLAQARNPQYGIWKNLVPFRYCPWCGYDLVQAVSAGDEHG